MDRILLNFNHSNDDLDSLSYSRATQTLWGKQITHLVYYFIGTCTEEQRYKTYLFCCLNNSTIVIIWQLWKKTINITTSTFFQKTYNLRTFCTLQKVVLYNESCGQSTNIITITQRWPFLLGMYQNHLFFRRSFVLPYNVFLDLFIRLSICCQITKKIQIHFTSIIIYIYVIRSCLQLSFLETS